MAKEIKTELIQVRTTLGLKKQAERNASEDARSLANYIEWLITQDTAKRKDSKR